MTPWWTEVVDKQKYIPVPAEPEALKAFAKSLNLQAQKLPAGYWDSLHTKLPALDSSDFLVVV